MPAGIAVTITSNRFPQAPALMRKAVAAAFTTVKGPILADMQQRTPVDTGALRASETAESSDTVMTFRAGTDHALPVHQGTSRMAARPFMRLAVEGAEDQIVQAIVDAANRELA